MSTTNFYQGLKELRNNPDTCNAGKKWTHEENLYLLENRKNGLEIQEIAKIHKRTEIAIRSQLVKQGIVMMNDSNLTEKEVCEALNLDLEYFKERKQKYENAKHNKLQKKHQTPKTQLSNKIYQTYQIDSQQSQLNQTQHINFDNHSDSTHNNYMPILIEIRDLLKKIVEL